MAHPLDFDSLGSLGRVLSGLGRTYFGILSARLSHLDIERSYYALAIVDRHPGPLTQKELAEKLGCDKTTMVRVADYLSDKGYMERRVDPRDRRQQFLALTPKAKRHVDAIVEALEAINAAAFKGVPAHKIKDFLDTLAAVRANLDALPAEAVDIHVRRRRRPAGGGAGKDRKARKAA